MLKSWLPMLMSCVVSATVSTLSSAADIQTPETASAVTNINQFGLKLYGALSDHPGNLFFSPYSISTALAMVRSGASGDTANELTSLLASADGNSSSAERGFAELSKLYQTKAGSPYELKVASALWGQKDFPFLPDFINRTSTTFGAQLTGLNFADPSTSANTINSWVDDRTNDKIHNLIDAGSIDSNTRLILTNAIYFKGTWDNPFAALMTRPQAWRGGEKPADVSMMHQKAHFGFFQDDQLQVLAMPYKGNDLSMVVMLPRELDLSALESVITPDAVNKLIAKCVSQEVTVSFPKFKMETSYDLVAPLKRLNLNKAFDPQQADFSGMDGRRDLYVTGVVHKAFIDVDEQGTEAAAATGVRMGIMAMPVNPAVFEVDHPFIFGIRDNRNGAILFMGRMSQPPQ